METEKENNKKNDRDFVIGVPKWQKICYIVILALGGVLLAATVILFILQIVSFTENWRYLAPGLTIIAVGCIGLYTAEKEKFILSNGVFTYIKTFKKRQSANAEDILKVVVERKSTLFVDVVFWGKDGKKLINFYDDGTAAHNIKFYDALDSLGIPYENLL